MDVSAWLQTLGLERYAQAFADNDVDASVLRSLTLEDLRDMGVASVGHRRRILDAIVALQAPPTLLLAAQATAPADPTRVQAAAVVQRRQVTVVFCDLIGSTALSVRVDPEDLREFLDTYYLAVTAVVQQYTGWIAQYVGDGVMACFGYPQASEHACEDAVRAALRIIEVVAGLPPVGGQTPQVRIGIATGLTAIGTPQAGTSGERLAEFSAVGEAPNLAARVQSESSPNGVVIAASTRDRLGHLFQLRDMGMFTLKGFEQPMQLWQVLGESKVASRFAALHGGRAHASLMGRESEIRRIAGRLASAQAGDGQLVLITGEAGMGKSRLVEHLFDMLGGDSASGGMERVVLQCTPHNVSSALNPVRSYIEREAGIVAEDARPAAWQKLTTLLERAGPVVTEQRDMVAELLRLEREAGSTLEGMASLELRERMMRALLVLLGSAAGRSALVIVEDLHWIDPSTSELLGQLVPLLRRRPVLMVATSRAGPYPAWLAGPHVGVVQLDRLEPEQTRRIVAAMAAPRQLPESVLDAIVERSDGVPLYAEELTRGYVEQAARPRRAGGDAAAEQTDGGSPIPATLAESLLTQLDRVAHGREVAPAASVLGREFPIALLVAISALPEPEVRRCVAELLDAGVFSGGRSRFGEAVAFRHMLVRDAAYQLLLRRDRVRLHGLVASTVESRFPAIAAAVPHIMAVHLAEAGETSRAVVQWQLAAADADRRSAYSEALACYRRALALARTMAPDTARDKLECDLTVNMIAPLIAVQGFAAPEVESEISRVAALSQKLGTRSSLMPALGLRRMMLSTSGNAPAAYALAVQMSELAEGGSETDRLIALRYLGTSQVFLGRFREAITNSERFLELYDAERHEQQLVNIGPANHWVMTMVGMAQCHAIVGEADRALHWVERSLLAARADGRAHTLAQTLAFGSCFVTFVLGEVQALARHADELRVVAQANALNSWQGHAQLYCGIAQVMQGRAAPGLELARRGVHLLVTTHAFNKAWYIFFAQACEEAGALEDARHGLELGAPTFALGLSWLDAEYLRLRGRVMLADGDADGALENFEAALKVAADQGAELFLDRARTDRERVARILSAPSS